MIDLIFIVAFAGAFILIMIRSVYLRAVVWDTFRHPFTASNIEICDGKAVIHHLTKGQQEDPPSSMSMADSAKKTLSTGT